MTLYSVAKKDMYKTIFVKYKCTLLAVIMADVCKSFVLIDLGNYNAQKNDEPNDRQRKRSRQLRDYYTSNRKQNPANSS